MRFSSYRLAFCRVLLPALLLFSTASFLPQVIAHSGDNEKFGTGESTGPKEVQVDEQGIKALQIKTKKVELEFLKDILKTTGDVQVDQTRAFNVTPPVSGVVKKVFVKQGDIVQAGEVLAVMHSGEVASNLTNLMQERNKIVSELARIKTQYNSDIQMSTYEEQLCKNTLEREESLLKLGISARKTFIEAKSAHDSAQLKLQTLKQKFEQEQALLNKQLAITIGMAKGQLKIMGINEDAVDDALDDTRVNLDLSLRAPVSGCIITRDVTLGERVEPSENVFSIVNLSPIWVMIDVFQEQIPKVKEGQVVYLETPSHERVTGKISSVGSIVEDITKTLHVRIIAQNPNEVLRPGMFVTAEIVLGQSKQKALLVPESAIVYYKDRPYVYEHEVEEGHFNPVPVTLGNKSGGQIEVLSGMKVGETVVISGANQLLAQSILKPDEDHEHEHEKHEDHHSHEESVTHQSGPSSQLLMGFGLGLVFAVATAIILAMLSRKPKNPGE